MQIKNSEILFPNGLKPIKVERLHYTNITLNSNGYLGYVVNTPAGYTLFDCVINDYDYGPGVCGTGTNTGVDKIYIYGDANKVIADIRLSVIYVKTELIEVLT